MTMTRVFSKSNAAPAEEPAPETENANPANDSVWRLPPHTVHDDPLLNCLVDITKLFGNPCTAQTLAGGLPLVENKLSPSLLSRAAARAQCSARLLRRELDEIPTSLLPCILLLKRNRACLLLEIRPDNYLVQFPEIGTPCEISKQALEADYTGVAAFIRPQFRFDARSPEVEKKRKGHWFWNTVFDNRRLYRDALVSAFLINFFALVTPLFTMNVYDRVVPNNAMDTLWVLAIGVFVAIVLNYILTTIRAHVVDTASKRIDVKLSAQIMEQVLDLKMESRPVSVGSFAANLRSFESVRDFIASASLTTLVDLPFVLIFLAALMWISPWMVIPPAIAIVIVLIVSWIAQAKMARMVEETFKASSQRNAVLVEALGGIETIKTLNAQGSAQRTWENTTKFLAQLGSKIKFLSAATVGFVQTAQQLVTIAVVIIGVLLLQDAAMTLGGIIASSMIAGRCLAPLGQVAGLMMQYQNARTSLESIDGYMKMPIEHPPNRTYVPRSHLEGSIEFRGVSFAYPGSKENALNGINLKINPGEKIGIIGRIGSGKSTLEKLILGLYAPSEGSVLIDGIDIRQIDPADVRRAVGHVPQDPVLFYGTLRHNLTLGAPFVDDDDMLSVAAVAGVDEFAANHPDGYDMIIGERGDSLSGGQRQSIAVARALINNPSILLLDEPSSNMDHQSEAALKSRLRKACEGKTMLIVTHRTAMLEIVDRLLVVDGGKIVADGPKAQVVDALRQGQVSRARNRS
jgi:ATP-binding cassette subfamily C protein LapB